MIEFLLDPFPRDFSPDLAPPDGVKMRCSLFLFFVRGFLGGARCAVVEVSYIFRVVVN